jgi:hypothetical protein
MTQEKCDYLNKIHEEWMKASEEAFQKGLPIPKRPY